MNKNVMPVVVGSLLFMIGIAGFCLYEYIGARQENANLQSEVIQIQQDISQLELVRDNLSDDLDKAREYEKALITENTGLKDKVQADQAAFTALEATLQETKNSIDTLNAQISVARQENTALVTQIGGLKVQLSSTVQEKDQMAATLSSVAELKKAIRELKRKARLSRRSTAVTVVRDEHKQVKEIIFGNRGFLVRDGRAFTPSHVRIEVQVTPENKQ